MEVRTEKEWHNTIKSAILSGEKITRWCQKQGIEKSTFYSHCRMLGYIRDGRRTEKWAACSAGSGIVSTKNISQNALELPSLIPVPRHTVCAVIQKFRESDLLSDRDPVPSPDLISSVCIQTGAFKIFVGDRFRKETLRDILEVIDDAQGS